MGRKRNPFPGETGIYPVCDGHNRFPHPGCGRLQGRGLCRFHRVRQLQTAIAGVEKVYRPSGFYHGWECSFPVLFPIEGQQRITLYPETG